MPAIRYQHNYKSVVLSDKNLHLKHPLLPAFLKDGSLVYYPFGGFVRREVLTYEQYVKLMFISAFSHTEEGSAWEDITSHKVLGVFIKGEYFVVLSEGKPIMVQ
ncbi:hypothetical protein [Enterovibrio norvegicus]|uniref:hypothetical protein n=1 Tax=Enterovibrio norvegicus TaxID=188144 RepID=UPI000C8159CD|nr:hypothetical protein [Enterovibrio norvegicus]PML78589.1 hypothetical protein BCT69_03950 [Enterovibrio norvegicus]PMN64436.1 hypothetical protein BCT27_10785 [Enterovibrio norvegicus]